MAGRNGPAQQTDGDHQPGQRSRRRARAGRRLRIRVPCGGDSAPLAARMSPRDPRSVDS
jgi:hypothetical protein